MAGEKRYSSPNMLSKERKVRERSSLRVMWYADAKWLILTRGRLVNGMPRQFRPPSQSLPVNFFALPQSRFQGLRTSALGSPWCNSPGANGALQWIHPRLVKTSLTELGWPRNTSKPVLLHCSRHRRQASQASLLASPLEGFGGTSPLIEGLCCVCGRGWNVLLG